MKGYQACDGLYFKTEEEARSHSRAVTDIAMANAPLYKRRIQKMMLNSHYGSCRDRFLRRWGATDTSRA